MRKLYVTMLGPSLSEKGGMGSVETLILKSFDDRFHLKHISTWDGEVSLIPHLHMVQVFIGAIFKFLLEILSQRTDLVHIHMAERGCFVRSGIICLIACFFRKPVIIHAHGCEFHLFYSHLPTFAQFVVRWVLQCSACFIVLSDSWKEFYTTQCGLPPQKVAVLQNPVVMPSEVPARGDGHQEFKFLFLGKINQRKGIFDLLHAFSRLLSEQPISLSLILAGSGEIEQTHSLAKDLGIEQAVVFPGWVTPEHRDQLLASADAFVLPSHNEGLPMALLEAMSWGLPVITTPVGGIAEIVTDYETGLLIEPGNIEQLKKAMENLIEDNQLRVRLGKAARARVAPLDINHYSTLLLNQYQTVIGKAEHRQEHRQIEGGYRFKRMIFGKHYTDIHRG